jgi:NDP-sugar pyrophosphorylase family protein
MQHVAAKVVCRALVFIFLCVVSKSACKYSKNSAIIRTFAPRKKRIARFMRQAMIFAAGLGTRLKPLTDTMPKALVPVGGRPLLDINIRRLMAHGYDRFVVNIHHFAQQIIDYVKEQDYAPLVHFSDESDQLLETGGGLKKAQTLFRDDQPILIHNVDILDNVNYDWFARQHQPDEDAVLLVSQRKTKRYLLFDNAMHLMGWKNVETGEIKSPYEYVRRTGLSQHGEELNMFAFSGIHSFSPRLFPLMERFPERFPIIDFYLSVCHRAPIVGLVKPDLQLMDVGKIETLDQAEKFIQSL